VATAPDSPRRVALERRLTRDRVEQQSPSPKLPEEASQPLVTRLQGEKPLDVSRHLVRPPAVARGWIVDPCPLGTRDREAHERGGILSCDRVEHHPHQPFATRRTVREAVDTWQQNTKALEGRNIPHRRGLRSLARRCRTTGVKTSPIAALRRKKQGRRECDGPAERDRHAQI
jgi:hypothetical protein